MAYFDSVLMDPMSAVSPFCGPRLPAVRSSARHRILSSQGRNLSREIRNDRIEQRETALGHAQSSAGGHLDRTFVSQNRNASRIEHAARNRAIARRVNSLDEPQPHQQIFVGDFA